MAVSQNGWPVVSRRAVDEAPLIRNIRVPNGVLAGDVAVVFRWLAREYDRRVERLVPGWCWGWLVKGIEGGRSISNHASGTAVDFNAPDNPMAYGATERSMTQRQINECHAIERESGGVLRWGGDFSRDDPMHWEIVAGPAATKKFADRIRAEQAGETEGFDGMNQAEFNQMLIKGLKAAAEVDPIATLMVRTNATTNKDVPELKRESDELRGDVAEIKAILSSMQNQIRELAEDPQPE